MKRPFDWADYVGFALGGAAVAVGRALGPRIPDPVPTHWNASGVADGFTPKPLGLYLPAIITFALAILMSVLPRISPRNFTLDPFARAFRTIKLAVTGFVFLISAGSLVVAATGKSADMVRWLVLPGMGALFVVLGNLMGKTTRNFFVGIRTPWTLANEEVWLLTHRLGGKVFVLSGLLLIAAGFLGAPVWVLIATVSAVLGAPVWVLIVTVSAAALIPTVASYVYWKRIEKDAPPAESAG
jgi:uncharacterized membrane protein